MLLMLPIFAIDLIRFSIEGLTSGSPPVILIFSTPKLAKIDESLIISSKERTSVVSNHFVLSFRHAISASHITLVCDRDS